MNVLIPGYGGKDTFDIRGRQLGPALDARQVPQPSADDWKWADVVILIKRWGTHLAQQAHAAGVAVVWDAVDFWSQPSENGFDEVWARQNLANRLAVIQPALFLGATQAQADAGSGAYLPHHSWRGLEPTPPRREVKRVAYDGNPVYLGRWSSVLARLCAARGWRFDLSTDGSQLRQADIIIALRDGPFDGWMCREWKSGVKLVNAIAAGRPVITQPGAAWREIEPVGSAIETVDELEQALDRWAAYEAREQAFERCRDVAPDYRLPAIADRYRTILAGVEATCRE